MEAKKAKRAKEAKSSFLPLLPSLPFLLPSPPSLSKTAGAGGKILRVVLLLSIALMISKQTEAQTVVKLSLKEAREMAVKQHPQVSAAALTALAADQVPKQLGAARFPNLQMNMTGAGAAENSAIAAGGLSNSSVLSRAATGFSLNQLLFDFGRNANLVESSRSRASAVEQTAAATRAQILLQVDRAYFAALRAQALLKVAEQTVATRQLTVEQTEALQKSGIKSGLDVSIANYNLAESRLLLARSQNDLRAAFAELSAAIGSNEEQTFDLADESLPAEPMAGRAEMINEALGSRPELKALQFDRDAAYQFLKAEKALKKPSVSAVWNAGWIPFRDASLPSRYNAAGINISIPIFNGRLFKAREAEAEFKARASEEQLKDAENRIVRDVRVAWLNADSAYQRINLAAQLLSRARESLDLAQERYRLGLSSIVELSQALLSVTVAEIENANAKFEYLVQRSVLDYQTGQLR
jgi:outer membrane protein